MGYCSLINNGRGWGLNDFSYTRASACFVSVCSHKIVDKATVFLDIEIFYVKRGGPEINRI